MDVANKKLNCCLGKLFKSHHILLNV